MNNIYDVDVKTIKTNISVINHDDISECMNLLGCADISNTSIISKTIHRTKSAPRIETHCQKSNSLLLDEDDDNDNDDSKLNDVKNDNKNISNNEDENDEEYRNMNNPIVCCSVAEDIGGRHSMEDTHVMAYSIPGNRSIKGFMGIFDGHNGPEAAQFLSDSFLTYFQNSEGTIQEALSYSFHTCEAALFDQYQKNKFCYSGATALVLLVCDKQIHIANLGDCRAVLSKSGGARALTNDHKPSDPVEKERIIAAGGSVDPENYMNGEIGVTRAMGDFHLAKIKKPFTNPPGPLISEPEFHVLDITPDFEFIIMGSDGLWDVLSNQRAVNLAREELFKHNTPQSAAQKLVEIANEEDSRDNITVAIVSLQPLPLPQKKSIPYKHFKNSRLRLASKSMLDLKAVLQNVEEENKSFQGPLLY